MKNSTWSFAPCTIQYPDCIQLGSDYVVKTLTQGGSFYNFSSKWILKACVKITDKRWKILYISDYPHGGMCVCVYSLERNTTEPWQQKKPSLRQVYQSNKPTFMVALAWCERSKILQFFILKRQIWIRRSQVELEESWSFLFFVFFWSGGGVWFFLGWKRNNFR